jgi:hypothetical protein
VPHAKSKLSEWFRDWLRTKRKENIARVKYRQLAAIDRLLNGVALWHRYNSSQQKVSQRTAREEGGNYLLTILSSHVIRCAIAELAASLSQHEHMVGSSIIILGSIIPLPGSILA